MDCLWQLQRFEHTQKNTKYVYPEHTSAFNLAARCLQQ